MNSVTRSLTLFQDLKHVGSEDFVKMFRKRVTDLINQSIMKLFFQDNLPATPGLSKQPAAQAAGADPFRCNSTNSQNPPIQKNYIVFDLMIPFDIL